MQEKQLVIGTTERTVQELLDAEAKHVQFIKKKTFEKAVDDGLLEYNIAGKTRLRKARGKKDKRLLIAESDEETQYFRFDGGKLTRLVGYIPTDRGFVEYRRIAAFFFLLIGILLAAAIVLIMNWNALFPAAAPDAGQHGGIGYEVGQTDSGPIIGPKTPREVRSFPNVTMPGYSTLKIYADTTEIDTISLYNPSQNKDWYDLAFRFEVDVNHEGVYRTLYESAKVSPGYAVSAFTITQALEAGSYDARIVITPYLIEDDSAVLNNGVIAITLTVESAG